MSTKDRHCDFVADDSKAVSASFVNSVSISMACVAQLIWQLILEIERKLRTKLHSMEPEAAQKEASFFPEEIVIANLPRRNAAYPKRIISQFEDELVARA